MSIPKGLITRQLDSQDVIKTPFILFQSHKDDFENISRKSLANTDKQPILARVYFSPENVEIIQRQIIAQVLKKTNGQYLIERQNEADVRAIMNHVFSQYAKNMPNNIRQQVQELNNITVAQIIPGIISEITAYVGYLSDTFGPRQVMDLPVNVSNAGSKLLPSETRRFDY